MSTFKKTKDMTERIVSEDSMAFTIPAEGFDKLVVYTSPKGRWTHKDYRIIKKSKKNK